MKMKPQRHQTKKASKKFAGVSGITQETAKTAKKRGSPGQNASSKEVATRNFFAPLRTTGMDTDYASTETSPQETTAAKTGRPPPIVLTSAVNLIKGKKGKVVPVLN
jgi:hypothetical protein